MEGVTPDRDLPKATSLEIFVLSDAIGRKTYIMGYDRTGMIHG